MIDPQLIVLVGAGAALLLLLGAVAASMILQQRARARRVRAAVGKRSNRNLEGGGLRQAQNLAWQQGMLAFMRGATRRLSIIKDRQAHEIRLMLVSAGYRSRDAIVVYTFFKLIAPIIALAGAVLWIYGVSSLGKGPYVDLAVVMGAALLGSKLPDMVVNNRRTKRLESIRKALPDSLDMLVICAEAGLASDAALKRVVAETGRQSSALSEELSQTAMELSFLPERRVALENLAERAPLPAVNAFVSTLIQAEKYGTPLARAFKVLSQEQRTERMLRAEEKAGRLPATMTVPMMLFILPALFIVLIGPAVINILDNFIHMK